jgi:hypothetical protein
MYMSYILDFLLKQDGKGNDIIVGHVYRNDFKQKMEKQL